RAGHGHDLMAAWALRVRRAARSTLQVRERRVAVRTGAKGRMHDGPPASGSEDGRRRVRSSKIRAWEPYASVARELYVNLLPTTRRTQTSYTGPGRRRPVARARRAHPRAAARGQGASRRVRSAMRRVRGPSVIGVP